ncbi:MAG: NAD(P)/FAD-dependent oxidoreductase [Acidobacteria bacterium]|nr:NAD(P)/FAD-dependent oxidoreductase [Acidobacteriota bacterium]
MDTFFDAVVIGGGPAGLSGALMLGRSRRKTLVVDAGLPRNRFASHMHGVLGHDGRPPADLLADGRAELVGYGVKFQQSTVKSAARIDQGFELTLDGGEQVRAKRILVATGLRDELPHVEGLAEVWGKGAATCPFCDGYEVRDSRIGVLATGPGSAHQAQLLRQWSADITYVVNGTEDPAAQELTAFAARGIKIERRLAASTINLGGRFAGFTLADGSTLELDALFTAPKPVPLDGILAQLGAEFAENPMGTFVTVDFTGKTTIDGVWAAGNVSTFHANVALAASSGGFAGAMITADLVQEEIATALAAH